MRVTDTYLSWIVLQGDVSCDGNVTEYTESFSTVVEGVVGATREMSSDGHRGLVTVRVTFTNGSHGCDGSSD